VAAIALPPTTSSVRRPTRSTTKVPAAGSTTMHLRGGKPDPSTSQRADSPLVVVTWGPCAVPTTYLKNTSRTV
jgi:hypothetical protein